MTILTPAQVDALRGAVLTLGALRGRCERREDEDARGLPWTLATERPTHASTAAELYALSAELLAIANAVEAAKE
jgi:hypothetical protein